MLRKSAKLTELIKFEVERRQGELTPLLTYIVFRAVSSACLTIEGEGPRE
jgi:hypothetical protein